MGIDSKYGKIDIKGIPENEPIFIFRARDPMSAVAIKAYGEIREALLPNDKEGQERIKRDYRTFKAYTNKRMPD